MKGRDESREAFLERMGKVYDEMMARAGSSDTFDDIEEQAGRSGREFERSLVEARLEAEEATQPAEVACPQCGRPMRSLTGPSERNLDTSSGVARYRRRYAACERCRESFFPSGPPAEDPPAGGLGPPPAHGV